MTIIRINNSKYPREGQISSMIANLKSLNKWDYIHLNHSFTDYGDNHVQETFQFAFQPGLDGTECSIHNYLDWPTTLFAYRCFMKNI